MFLYVLCSLKETCYSISGKLQVVWADTANSLPLSALYPNRRYLVEICIEREDGCSIDYRNKALRLFLLPNIHLRMPSTLFPVLGIPLSQRLVMNHKQMFSPPRAFYSYLSTFFIVSESYFCALSFPKLPLKYSLKQTGHI
jgi:hypothetical protein